MNAQPLGRIQDQYSYSIALLSPPIEPQKLKKPPSLLRPPFSFKKYFRVKCNDLMSAHDIFHRNIANF